MNNNEQRNKKQRKFYRILFYKLINYREYQTIKEDYLKKSKKNRVVDKRYSCFFVKNAAVFHLKRIQIVSNGHQIKKARKVISRKTKTEKMNVPKSINTLFTTIPIPIEKATNPFLYSFLSGLKKVLIISGRESI